MRRSVTSNLPLYFLCAVVMTLLVVAFPGNMIADTGDPEWSYNGDGKMVSPSLSPQGSVLYMISRAGEYTTDGRLIALDLGAEDPPNEKWAIDLPTGVPQGNSPVVGSEGTIYISTYGEFYAINPGEVDNKSDRLKWEITADYEKDVRFSSPALADDGTLYVPAIATAEEKGYIYKISSNGIIEWKKQLGNMVSDLTVTKDGTVFALVANNTEDGLQGDLYALNSEGVKWRNLGAVALPEMTDSPVIGPEGNIYAACPGRTGACKFAADDGSKLGQVDLPDASLSSMSIGPGGFLYVYLVATDSEGVYKVDTKEMEQESSVSLKSGNPNLVPAIGQDGVFYTGTFEAIHAIYTSMGKKWSFGSSVKGKLDNVHPVLGPDGTVYVPFYSALDGSSTLYALETDSSGLANSSWPMAQHDPLHTSYSTVSVSDGGEDSGENNSPNAKAEVKSESWEEGTKITLDASDSSDHDGYIETYEWDVDNDGEYEIETDSSTTTHKWGDNYDDGVTLKVTDDDGATATDDVTVTIKNVPPKIEEITVEGPSHPNGEIWTGDQLNFSSEFTDPGWDDTHSGLWKLPEARKQENVTDKNEKPNSSGEVTVSHTYYEAGTYTVELEVVDDDEGSADKATEIEVIPIPAAVDCEPDTLNLRAGTKWVTAYIGLPDGYDIWEIEGTKVTLAGVEAYVEGDKKWATSESNDANVDDYDDDENLERMVKFTADKLQKVLEKREEVELALKGKVTHNNGSADFQAKEKFKIIDKGGNRGGPPEGPGKGKPFGLDSILVSSNPVTEAETIKFKAQGERIRQIRVEIFNIKGLKVYDSGFQKGSAQSWDLVDDSGTPVANGLYLYRVKVEGKTDTATSMIRRLLVIE